MTELTLAEKKAYLTTGPAGAVDWEDPEAGLENNTKTIAEWVALGNTRAISRAVNDAALGVSLGIIVPAGRLQTAEIKNAISKGSEWPVQVSDSVVTKLNFSIGDNSIFDTSDSELVQNIKVLLEEPYPNCWAKFQEILTKNGTIAEHLGGLTQEEINALVAG